MNDGRLFINATEKFGKMVIANNIILIPYQQERPKGLRLMKKNANYSRGISYN